MKRFPLLAFSKDRPFVAPESPSPLPNRIPPILRRSAATPPARSDRVVSHHFAGLLLVDPVRTVAAAHDPGVHRRFTRALKTEVPVTASKEAARFPRCVSALRSFPSADSCGRWTLWRHLAMRAVHAGRLSPPARLSPCSAARLTPSLEAHESCRPEGPLNPHPKRSPASKVHQPPYRPVVHSLQEVAFPLHVRPRGLSPSSGPLRGRRFRLPCPVLPWAWAPRCARHVPEGPHVFAKRSRYVKDRFLRTRLSAC